MSKTKKKSRVKKSPYEKFSYTIDPGSAQLAWTLIVGIVVALVAFEHVSAPRHSALIDTGTKEAFEQSQTMR